MTPVVSADSPPGVPKDCQSSFFGLVPWYHYIGNELTATGPDGHCDVQCFNLMDQGTKSDGTPKTNHCGQSASDIPLVLLAIVDDLLRVAGLAAVIFVLYGALRYTASQGDPEQTAKAQSTVVNALVGTAIAITAVAFVSFLGSKLGS
jgi:hypothetical protein